MKQGTFEINLPKVAWTVAFAILVTDALASPLRFYLTKSGLAAMAYFPKALGLLLFGFSLLAVLQPVVVWSVLALFSAWSVIAIVNGIPLPATAFSIFQWTPFLLGLVCSPPDETSRRRIYIGIGILWALTLLGVWLDVFLTLPWEGSEMVLAGQTIENNRSWTTIGIERPAGFTRISAAAAMYAASTGLLLFMHSRGRFMKTVLMICTILTVAITTNKSVIAGLLGALLFAAIYDRIRIRYLGVASVAALVIGLPIYSVLNKVVLDINDVVSIFLFASFDDRMINTWPTFLHAVHSLTIGEGLGGVGAPVMYFHPGSVLGYADNYSLYLIGTFGVFAGLTFFVSQSFAACRLAEGTGLSMGVSVTLFMLLLGSATTDVIEGVPAAFLIGLSLRLAYGGPQSRLLSLWSLK